MKLSDESVSLIRKLGREGNTAKQIADRFRISSRYVRLILSGAARAEVYPAQAVSAILEDGRQGSNPGAPSTPR